MNRLLLSILAVLFFLLSQTTTASQQEDQELCVQQVTNDCIQQCEKTNDIDCSAACPENAHNQCRQAGE